MIIMHPNAKVIPKPVTVDIAKLLATSFLVGHGNFAPLPPQAREFIQQTIQEQLLAKQQGVLLPARYIVTGEGSWTLSSILDSSQHNRFHLSCGCGPGHKQ